MKYFAYSPARGYETIETKVEICCANCINFKSEGPTHEQPYPELWCSKGHWDGLCEPYEEIDCTDFEFINKEL